MFVKIKLKRSANYVEITPENFKDIDELLCIKEYPMKYRPEVVYKVGQKYRTSRREYSTNSQGNKICNYATLCHKESGMFSWYTGMAEIAEHFKGRLIKRRKKKDEVQSKATEAEITQEGR